MTRKILALLVVLNLAVFGLAGCGSDSSTGSDSPDFTAPFNFAGTWTVTSTMMDNGENWNKAHAEGSVYTHTVIITQSGTSLTLKDMDGHYDGKLLWTGTCDPTTGTFSTTFVAPSVVYTYTGQAMTNDSMTFVLQGDEGPNPPSFPSGKHVHAEGTGTR